MDNIILEFEYVGQGTMFFVDDDSYDELFKIYDNQQPGGYEIMYERFNKKLDQLNQAKNFKTLHLQYNSHDHMDEPITFKRILQVLAF